MMMLMMMMMMMMMMMIETHFKMPRKKRKHEMFLQLQQMKFEMQFMNDSRRFDYIAHRLQFQSGVIKVKLSLCLTKHHAMKAYWGSGGIAPLILLPRH
jgi:hypothetical protein